MGTGCFLELNGTGKLNDPNYPVQWLQEGDVVEMIITELGTSTTDDIQVFYVNYLKSSVSEAFREAVFPAPLGENIIAAAKYTPGGGYPLPVHFQVAHELGHLLLNDGLHPSNTYQIMRSGASTDNTLGAAKRFTDVEINKMKKSKHAK